MRVNDVALFKVRLIDTRYCSSIAFSNSSFEAYTIQIHRKSLTPASQSSSKSFEAFLRDSEIKVILIITMRFPSYNYNDLLLIDSYVTNVQFQIGLKLRSIFGRNK